MKQTAKSLSNLYAIQVLVKGFSVFYFVLLPVYYAEKLIGSAQLGYIGALFIVLLIIGAVVVARWLHGLDTKKLLQGASLIAILATAVLLIGSLQDNLVLVIFSYGFMGLAVGIAMSGVNAVAAHLTIRGDRFKSLAKMSMLTDIVRIVFPTLVAGMVLLGASSAAVLLIIATAIVFLLLCSRLPKLNAPEESLVSVNTESLKTNKSFRYILSLEFFDSFSSSQLFVFLPLVFLAKGHSLESSLLLQSFIFAGYMSGRWLVSLLAKRFSGLRAIAYAEVGMVICIFLLLVAQHLWLLYVLSFALGVFARGTSPAIKALAFDSLTEVQIRKGSAVHVIAGGSGSALGQLLFGLLIAWYGVNAPFIVAAVIAGLIAAVCMVKPFRMAH